MKQSGSNRILVPLLGVLVVGAVYLLVLKPQGGQLAEARDAVDSVEMQLDTARAALAQAEASGGDPAAVDSDAAALVAAVPPTVELPGLLRHLQQIATETGMTYVSVTPSPPVANPAGPGSSVQLSISASGNFEAVDAYIARLRDMPRLIVIEQMTMAPTETDVLQLTITARAFSTAPPPAESAD